MVERHVGDLLAHPPTHGSLSGWPQVWRSDSMESALALASPPRGVDRRCSTAATTEATSPQWSGIVGSYRSQPFPKRMGPTGYGRDGYSGRETTGGELTIPTWPGRWHTLELPVAVH
jgi:hypothetical protein